MRRTKYYDNYGYYTFYEPKYQIGDGVLDNVTELFKSFASNDLVKHAVSNAGKAAAKSVGRKLGSVLGDKIADKAVGNRAAKIKHNINETKIREKVLDDLKLLPNNYTRIVEQYGEGFKRKKKIRGAGLKILS